MFKKKTALFVPLLFACSTSLFAAKFGLSPEAHDDHASIVVGSILDELLVGGFEGNVLGNDFNGTFVDFIQMTGKYGFLSKVESNGDYTYTLHASVTPSSIPQGEVVKDIFPYILSNNIRQTSSANLVMELSTVNIPRPVINSNVDIEINDRSFQATPLNSGKNILGHLQGIGDKDWYSLASAGNEVITLEACPQSSGCFGKKSWVLYVFDGDRLTSQMETQTFPLRQFIKETGEVVSTTPSNHMYLAYRAGFFDGALVGVVDPCFDTNNTVSIGVGPGSRNYLVAISSPLLGDADGDGGSGEDIKCGGGFVVLLDEEGSPPVVREVNVEGELNDDGSQKTETVVLETSQEFISSFPFSDDQYTINISGTGPEPLLSDEAAAKSATYNSDTGELIIPKVLIGDKVIEAELQLEKSPRARSGESKALIFGVERTTSLSTEELNPFVAKLNPQNGQVTIPRVSVNPGNKPYAAILRINSIDNIEVIQANKITEK